MSSRIGSEENDMWNYEASLVAVLVDEDPASPSRAMTSRGGHQQAEENISEVEEGTTEIIKSEEQTKWRIVNIHM